MAEAEPVPAASGFSDGLSDGLSDRDRRWLRRALAAGERGQGRTAPNPSVGAVIVRDGACLAEGWTQPPGQEHAEIHAIQRAGGADLRGATVYVTLEPCCHRGRTPPCTEALIRAGVARVVAGAVDPFPPVAGQGLARLRAAGIAVAVAGIGEPEGEACVRANLGFFRSVLLGLPMVVMKAAITLDGRIASASGESRWITGGAARAAGHRRRDRSDAVLVGAGTVRADDPMLDTRLAAGEGVDGGSGRDARAAVLDTRLRTPLTARLLARGPLILCGGIDGPEMEARAAALAAAGAEVCAVGVEAGRVGIAAAARELARRGYHRVLAEGGGGLHRSLLGAGLVTEGVLYMNARVLGGGPGFVAGPGWALGEAPGFRFGAVERAGEDLEIGLVRPLEELLPGGYLALADRVGREGG